MLINEQKYTNKYRIYYRGIRTNDVSQKNFKEIYLTTKFPYALSYAKMDGIVEEYCLKDTANIFNMKCKTDEGKLRVFCQNHYQQYGNYLKCFEELKENDWGKTLGLDGRIALIIAIKSLGYDGYFNYEIDENFYKEIRKYPWCRFSELQIKSPAIAIFNENAIKKITSYNKTNFTKFDIFNKIKKEEKKSVLSDAYDKNEEEAFKLLRNRILTLSDEELKKQIKLSHTENNINLQEERIKNYEEVLKERFGDNNYFNY